MSFKLEEVNTEVIPPGHRKCSWFYIQSKRNLHSVDDEGDDERDRRSFLSDASSASLSSASSSSPSDFSHDLT